MTLSANDDAPAGHAQDAWDADALAYQRFIAAARGFWSNDLFKALRRQVEEQANGLHRAHDDYASFVEQHPTHRIFAWLERHMQRMKYSGPYGLAAAAERHRTHLVGAL